MYMFSVSEGVNSDGDSGKPILAQTSNGYVAMQANYPNKIPPTHWDTLNVKYPVRQFVSTGTSSEETARRWRGEQEIIKEIKQPCFEETEYCRDYNVTKELTHSQSAIDYGYKTCERFRVNKHTPCQQNQYFYPISRKLSDRVPASTAHGNSEMRSAYEAPRISSRLVTDKDQYKLPACTSLKQAANELETPPNHWPKTTATTPNKTPKGSITTCPKQLDPLDTTYEGYEKYLDPYLTTSRLHHRPYTAHELSKASNSRDIMTYYTYADIPWVRVPRPNTDEWGLPIKRPKSMYDREKFKEDFREIRTHNKLLWVPGTFRTESRDNYVQQTSRPEAKIHNHEEEVRTLFQRLAGQLSTNVPQEDSTIFQNYSTENSIVGSKKPICAIINPFKEINKRLVPNSP